MTLSIFPEFTQKGENYVGFGLGGACGRQFLSRA
jgi:hypothetical protein